ncbi:MAG: methylmalonyl Co-A mutase-associated GTPase MeaB [Anaerolineales bacterium]
MFDPAPILSGNRLALARLLTQVENGIADEALASLFPHTGRAHLIGVTGAPGTGKSSLVTEMAKTLRRAGQTLAIVAVDPSSPFTGGAILGDRIRMRDLSGDPGIFIRSMASRGALGGLARATADVVKVLDAAGFDRIIIETVGAGQSEVDIARTAHTTVVVEAPGLGDEVQGLKAGILEIADVLVLNKADTPGAELALRALRAALEIGHAVGADSQWAPPLMKTVAVKGEGVAELMEAIERHHAHLQTTGLLQQRERERLKLELEARVRDALFHQLLGRVGNGQVSGLVDKLVAREIDPVTATKQLLGVRD